jgi:hypothetical protein
VSSDYSLFDLVPGQLALCMNVLRLAQLSASVL